MDYIEVASFTRYVDWDAFAYALTGRVVLLTTAGELHLGEAEFRADDTLLLGSESRGVPELVHGRADLRVRIPQVAGTRSLNIAVAAGIALGEALRQTGGWPR
jgi:tRNA (cytidine/uridine-2'-O-)-methyltransferase